MPLFGIMQVLRSTSSVIIIYLYILRSWIQIWTLTFLINRLLLFSQSGFLLLPLPLVLPVSLVGQENFEHTTHNEHQLYAECDPS